MTTQRSAQDGSDSSNSADVVSINRLDISSSLCHPDFVVIEPLSPQDAKRFTLVCIESGSVFPSAHALIEMGKDGLTMLDAVNVLRGGAVDPAEWENGSWRYKFRTTRMAFVAAFDLESNPVELTIVTAWRYKS